jgi:multidrug transporter EmrE-like cation transporter
MVSMSGSSHLLPATGGLLSGQERMARGDKANSARFIYHRVSQPMHEDTRQKHLHFKTRLMIGIMILAGPLGNVLLGKGMKKIGALTLDSVPDALHSLQQILSSSTIWLGIGLMLCFFVAYSLVLSWADYSYVQPASAMGYAMGAVLAVIMLHETVSPMRWLGIAVISLGVFVVGRTHPNTTESR